jgi:acetyl/propionyl-CoA carboxylase alpha subunit
MSKVKRIFIANRGEIARRIASSAKQMGIESVVITDQQTPPAFLQKVVTDFIIVEQEDTSLYLNSSKMIELALKSGCNAVHPGFGFLSENANFASQVVESGLIWIGPKASVIDSMASKANARSIAEEAGVPCTPGLKGFSVPKSLDGDFSELESFAKKTGYPLLLKAALGGGGKGMRLVRKQEELKDAALRAYSEGLSSFGDGSLICERYLENSRHIEVQIIGDHHGQVIALGDRDCSIQRRHQKIIEEAPAFQLGKETRRRLHEAAVKLAQSVNYQNAGTVEFLVDWSNEVQSLDFQPFYFLEMNTRLQVEHPVTEEIHGVDLVEWQIRIAEGQKLSEQFLNAQIRGHSIEVRLYAEDCLAHFFPSPGKVKCFAPANLPGLRYENGIDTIDEITPKFDPMIAKIIATADTRERAIKLLSQALKETKFVGPATNKEYLIQILDVTPFAHAAQSTKFIDSYHEKIVDSLVTPTTKESFFNSVLTSLEENLGTSTTLFHAKDTTHEQIANWAFSNQRTHNRGLVFDWSTIYKTARFPNEELVVGEVQIGGQPAGFCAFRSPTLKSYSVFDNGKTWTLTREKDQLNSGAHSSESESEVLAPVPGKVIKILTDINVPIEKNQNIFILESMKMEFEVKATKSGMLGELSISEGEQVTSGQLLARWNE